MDVLDWLAAALDAEGDTAGVLTTDPALLDAARTDRSGWVAAGMPLAIVNARSVGHVQATLRAASEFRIPVVPRGAGTGLAGGANGTDGSLVLDVSAMNRIVEISAEDQLAVIEPGVVNSDLNDALEPYGLFFAPDPASKAISTVGGNIATNAGGLLCAKYGVTREAVLGLDVVLADGRLLKTGHRTAKGVTGYDLTALFVGSEGTLGVIVGATVRAQPIPPGEPVTLGALFADVRAAAAASARITAARLRPAVMELLDAPALERISAYLGAEQIEEAFGASAGAAYLLVQFDGPTAAADAGAAGALLAEGGGTVRVAADADEGERLLALRRAFHPALASSGEVLIEDVAVPRSRMPEMFDAIERISQKYGIPIPTVAHAGDGNLHPNFVYTGETVPEAVWDAANDLFRTAIELGGTLTGEHGVGVLKRRWLADELGADSYELQVKLKSVFDPLGILNPGKVFGGR
jgi:glycolate oxidase